MVSKSFGCIGLWVRRHVSLFVTKKLYEYFCNIINHKMKLITSTQNPFIKQLVQLQEKAKSRRQEGLFIIEGQRELELARKGGFALQTVLFVPDMLSESQVKKIAGSKPELIEISREVYQKLAYRDTTEGVIAVAQTKDTSLANLILKQNPLILVAEATEKPGNLGAMLRTADAARLDAVIIANPRTDLYNPNIVRNSMGCLFTNQIATGSTEEVIAWLKEKNINIYCATLQDSALYHLQDYTGGSALVVGTEATGLTQPWRDASTKNIIIPMQGEIDSMNVSVAAAILIFEAKRQRGFAI
jgi:RNA methyltransferase, TrmH family